MLATWTLTLNDVERAIQEQTTTIKDRILRQNDTIDWLNNLTILDRTVTAYPVEVLGQRIEAFRTCDNDTTGDHGMGTIVLGDTTLCPDCGIPLVQSDLVEDANLEVGVLL